MGLSLLLPAACVLLALYVLSFAQQGRGVQINVAHGPQRPSAIPLLPGLNVGRNYFFTNTNKKPQDPDYAPFGEDSVTIHNGPRALNHPLTSGVWRLDVGDRPRLRMRLRGTSGAYAQPALLDGLGVGGEFRLLVTVGGKSKHLDEFDSIGAVISPGSARWVCSDKLLGVKIELDAIPFEELFGFAATVSVSSDAAAEVTLAWTVKDIALVKETKDYAEFSWGEYTQVFLGLAERGAKFDKGQPRATLSLAAGKSEQSRLVCVWGYSDYNHQAVEDAYKRLEYRPFADRQWLEQMKKQWFHHWIGKGLLPREKFLSAMAEPEKPIGQAREFWLVQRSRLRIQTPDARFDTVVNNTAAEQRNQYEYPAWIHGVEMGKYGKINCGYYGYDDAGYHQEVKDSLKFLTGTQDIKGRMRYFMPTFAISIWCEEHNFYFVEQVWNHYRWTGDREFVKAMWPSVRAAMEQGLTASDPDGDGVMTGYYETWNCDNQARGGKCALWTGMAVAALRSAAEMAKIVDDKGIDGYDLRAGNVGGAHSSLTPRQRYTHLLERSAKALHEQLWNREIGAFCSAEWNGDMRPHPEAMEQNYIIWRGMGDSMQKYMAMRYVRENFHLHTAPGVTIELMNDWWPIEWSHHYVANGDSCISVLSAAKAGDIDRYWPSLKTVSETLYRGDSATMCHGTLNDGRGSGMKQLVEIEPQFVQAVVEGLFGVEPYIGDNVIVLRPALPGDWPSAQISLAEVQYKFARGSDSVTLDATTPVARDLRIEAPVTGAVEAVTLNGQPVEYALQSDVNCCRVVVLSRNNKAHRVEIKTRPQARVASVRTARGEGVSPSLSLVAIAGREARFEVENATIARILDPQEKLSSSKIEASTRAILVPRKVGKCTVFLELAAGKNRWLAPLDLDVRESWSIVERLRPRDENQTPAVLSPSIDPRTKTLTLEIEKNELADLPPEISVTVGGETFKVKVDWPSRGVATVTLGLEKLWDRLSPGSVPVTVKLAGRSQTAEAVNWDIGSDLPCAKRLHMLDISSAYDIAMTNLYHHEFKWRHDYTGCGVGIDWRDPLPPCDKIGYVLMTSPVEQFEYQSLPEGWVSDAVWKTPAPRETFKTRTGVSFHTAPGRTDAKDTPCDILALTSTEPYEQLPSSATMTLAAPAKLEKLYLLTANLTKTLKCYYPGAELVVHYESGPDQVVPMTPPHNMPIMSQNICPRAYAVDFGDLTGSSQMVPLVMGGKDPNLSVTDVVLDPARKAKSFEFRCVASETILGLVGLTVLEARV